MKNFKQLGIAVYLIISTGLIGWWVYAQFYEPAQKTDVVQTSSPNNLDRQIAGYEEKLITQPEDVSTMHELALAYLQKVRDTADVSYYAKVEDLASKAIKLDPSNAESYALQAEVALGKHNFHEALRLGQKSVVLNPYKAHYYGIIADAQTELGQNDAAIATLQKMVDTRPDYSSYSRIAYARELYGEIDSAKQAINMAVESGSVFPENIAWGFVESGKLALRSDLDEAEDQFQQALDTVPDYAPALEGLGRVAFARGNLYKASEYFQKAFDRLPIAQYAIDLGDLNRLNGDEQKASQYYALAKAAFDSSQSGGVNTDMERAAFLAEHDLDLPLAKQLAEKSFLVRPSIYGADTLAWALYKNNDIEGAQKYIQEALRLGEHDPLIVFHAAKIADKAGNKEQARKYFQTTFNLNPHFSILHSKELLINNSKQ